MEHPRNHRSRLDVVLERLRWEPVLAGIAASSVTLAMPDSLSIGPRWLLPVVVVIMMIPTTISHHLGRHSLNHILGIATIAVMTAALCGSLLRLVDALPKKTESPTALLTSALLLWLANIVVFALWHWRLDGGGPVMRRCHIPYGSRWFLFPQLQIESGERKAMGADRWSPSFIDYLFVAFNTSTAFSPTDTLVLSPWAKFLSMLQALISLMILVLLVARGINVL